MLTSITGAYGGLRFRYHRGHVCTALDWIAGLSQAITLGEKDGVRAKAIFWRELAPGALLTSSDMLLVQSSLGKWVRDFYNLGKVRYAYWV